MCCGGMAGSVNAAGALRNWNVIISFRERLAGTMFRATLESYVLPAIPDCMAANCPTGLARMPQVEPMGAFACPSRGKN